MLSVRKILTLKKHYERKTHSEKWVYFDMKNKISTKDLTKTAMIAGLYAAITFATFYISFGAVQYRVSEALTVLPAFTGLAVPGLTLGCVIANLFGFIIGANPLGLLDALVGSLATLLAALVTRKIAKKISNPIAQYALCPLPPVIFNAIIVGLELTFVFTDGSAFFPQFTALSLSVLIGEAVVCYLLGIPLMIALKRHNVYKKIFEK